MFNLKYKLPSFFIKRPSLIVLLLVYLGILVAIYLASPPPGQAVRPMRIEPAGTVGFPLVAFSYVAVSLILVVLLFTLKRKSWRELKPLNDINPLWFFFVVGLGDVLEQVIGTTFGGFYHGGHIGPDKVGSTLIQNLPGWIVPGALLSMPMILYSYIWKRWNRKAVHVGIMLSYIGIITTIMLYQKDFEWIIGEKSLGAFIWVLSCYAKLAVPFVAILLTKNIKQRIAVVLAFIVLFVSFHQFMFVHQVPQRSLLKLSVDVKDVPSGEISVDGDFADWSGFQPIFVDPRGDSEDPILDIREIFAATNGKELFIAFKTSEPLDPSSQSKSFNVELDTNSDYRRDYSVSGSLRDRDDKVIAEDNFMANKGEGYIEFRVPLENIKIGAEKIAINVVSYGLYNQQPANYEESDWIFLRIK